MSDLPMTLGHLHTRYVLGRRADILASHLTALAPRDAKILDIGSGDGRLARALIDRRHDLDIVGVDLLVRPDTAIPVQAFDGNTLPLADGTVDVALFVDVLHHTDDPMVLLREACRVSRRWVLIKDHIMEGWAARRTLRLMDWVGNAHHGVALPYNYWRPDQWNAAFSALGLRRVQTIRDLGIYPRWADWCFGRGLHFISLLEKSSS